MEDSQDSLDSLCNSVSKDLSFAVLALFLWIEELPPQHLMPPTKQDEALGDNGNFILSSLNVNWRDVSIAYAAEMKEPKKEVLEAAPTRFAPVALLHDTLGPCEFCHDAVFTYGTQFYRGSSASFVPGRMKNLLNFLHKRGPDEWDETADGALLDMWGEIMDTLLEKLSSDVDIADDVFHNVRLHLEDCIKTRVAKFVTSNSNARRQIQKNSDTALDQVLPRESYHHGETDLIEDHPLKSVSFV